jgi:hypothetical protein
MFIATSVQSSCGVLRPEEMGTVRRGKGLAWRQLGRLALALLLATEVCMCGSVSKASNPPNYPTGEIELKYYADGRWAPVSQVIGENCGNAKYKCDLYYPRNLGSNGFRHPCLTWGNGSWGKSQDVALFLRHMASWGFVVIATEDPNTGEGQTILDAATFLINANTDSKSIFYQKLNTDKIGSFGASQGAGGAINAMIKSGGRIKTVVPIEFPSRIWCTLGPECADTKKISFGSIFLIDGSADAISPPTQPSFVPGVQSIAAAYEAVPEGVEKVKGTLEGPNHNDITGQPSCQQAKWPCANGVYGYLGYPTAWMMAQLQGDTYARSAFVQGSGEMFAQTTNWEYVASNLH